METQGKTVFVLGAGFSKGAGIPLQSEIIGTIRRLTKPKSIMSGPALASRYAVDRKTLLSFLGKVFPKGEEPSLEDVYTLLDQTIGRRAHCGRYDWRRLDKAREALNNVILYVFHSAGEQAAADEALATEYRRFAAFLVNKRIAAKQGTTPFGIISLNWDSLLEESIFWCIRKVQALHKIDVDYCCFTSPLGESCPHTPSLYQKAKGLYNIKVMKLHGSVSWLICPNCNRLYTGVGGLGDVWYQYMQTGSCIECRQQCVDKSGKERSKESDEFGPRLEAFFITPTYVKVFPNAHIQMTWHNAHIDLSKASEVVFIGYSLPEADYHVKTLLRRCVRADAKITVVLTESDRPDRTVPPSRRSSYATVRYETFFGPERIKWCLGGVQAFFHDYIGELDLDSLLGTISGGLAQANEDRTAEIR